MDDRVSGEGQGDRFERLDALEQLEGWLRAPMLALSFAWLAIVLAELAWGSSRLLEVFGTAIWAVFVLEFGLRFALAPEKLPFLRANWLTVLSLLAPALRMVRMLRWSRKAIRSSSPGGLARSPAQSACHRLRSNARVNC